MDIMVLGSIEFKTLISLNAGRPTNTRWKNSVRGDGRVINLQCSKYQGGCIQMIYYTNN